MGADNAVQREDLTHMYEQANESIATSTKTPVVEKHASSTYGYNKVRGCQGHTTFVCGICQFQDVQRLSRTKQNRRHSRMLWRVPNGPYAMKKKQLMLRKD